jgi:hypothetical protein
MKHPQPKRELYLGVRAGDLDGKPYAKYWNPQMAPLSPHAREAVVVGPVASALLPPLAEAPRLLESGDQELENGFGLCDDGSLHVAVRTEMPNVAPAMWDWWFGWHSDEPQRYKLWHPRAHVYAAWDRPPSGAAGRERYLGRVSFVDEYLGSELSRIAVQFVPPALLGFNEGALGDGALICARIGFTDHPLDFGWLIHHVRRVAGGAEMRSRFFIGGAHGAVRGAGRAGEVAARAIGRFVKPTLDNGRDLLVHCAQEMAHLAAFLPALHDELRGSP